MFSLEKQRSKFEHMSTFTEKHGEDDVNGLAIKLSTAVPHARLDDFDPGLATAIYRGLSRRFAGLGPLRWERELVGAHVQIDGDDLLGKRRVTFEEAIVDKFVIEPLDGGSMNVTMRAKVKPTPEQVAILYQLQHTDVHLTIDPAGEGDEKSARATGSGELELDDEASPAAPAPSAKKSRRRTNAKEATPWPFPQDAA